jgi:hypothetical protein
MPIPIAMIRVCHGQFLIGGWLTQLILGEAWWLSLPCPLARGLARSDRAAPLFWATFAWLNADILLRSSFEPRYALTQANLYGLLTGISGLFLLAAAVAFVVSMWVRVREVGRGKT